MFLTFEIYFMFIKEDKKPDDDKKKEQFYNDLRNISFLNNINSGKALFVATPVKGRFVIFSY